ncbi:flagellar biosynthesis protein FlhF [Viridibacillus sp. YIM B01967]|uniref:Flagellar biosynthesis protein FlhF n=1 Tax=Viridibacillus soli TaxID=2798301 RepID=A0ABS1H4P7_9BACL|nr:flagellar biosynthesis protein FlhF [Viridibacillus soli]MBK3494372.1 flagellar biosynthesis protein FlhF [Viridibacillus soli]
MKMKKYVEPSMPAAMKKVRADFGEDAVIVNSKVVYSKGFLGLFKKKSIEVVAGLDRAEVRESAPLLAPTQVDPIFDNHIQTEQNSEEIKKEIAHLKVLMQSMQRYSVGSKYPDELLPLIEQLEQQELNQELVTLIGDELFAVMKSNKEDLSQEELLNQAKKSFIAKMEQLPFGGISYEKKYINVLGPTGVGKTTTIAKMAARAVLEKKQKIGFITTDTYRIGAIEQLKTYANLLQAPVEIVYNKQDYEQALAKFEHLDLIFIDTAGRNYKEVKYVEDVKALIDFDKNMESFLVLSMTSKERDMEAIIQQFLAFPIAKLIFTKLDETNSIGSMINLMVKYNKGLAYYTTGQEVPEDIEEASFESVVELFFQGDKK